MNEQMIVCPNCGHSFPASKVLTAQIEATLRKEFHQQSLEKTKALQQEFERKLATERDNAVKAAVEQAEKTSAEKLSKLNNQLTEAETKRKAAEADYSRKLKEEKTKIKQSAEKEVRASVTQEIDEMRKQLAGQKAQLQEAKKTEASLKERERMVKEKEEGLQSTIKREVEAVRKKAMQEASEKADREYENRERAHQKVNSDLRKKLADARRQLEQESQQTKGEVVELELEKLLARTFPDDKVKPVAKGKQGADIIHRVCSPGGQPCGTIVWETKNTKSWNKAWLAKLRADQRKEKAEIAVIVSTALPKDLTSRFGQVSGVWVADFSVAIGLAVALRGNLIEVSRLKLSTEGKTEKMEMLYHYLMSTEFKQRVEAVVEAFVSMKDDLDKERQTTEKNWAKREKQLQLVIQNISGMIGDFQAIAPALPKIKRLELPGAP